MRILIAVVVVCALGAPLASALPIAKSGAGLSQRSADVLDVKAKGGKSSHASSKSRKSSAGGIHPLVGSGDY